MRMIKNRVMFFVCAAMLCGCGNDKTEDVLHSVGPHYIHCYCYHELDKIETMINEENKFVIVVDVSSKDGWTHYYCGSRNKSYRKKFNELAVRHNDTGYTGYWSFQGLEHGVGPEYCDYYEKRIEYESDNPSSWPTMLYAEDFEYINITADKDWDDLHPAGASLNDLFFVNRGYNPYYYIKNGYSGEAHYDDKPIADLVSGDLWCLYWGKDGLMQLYTTLDGGGAYPDGGVYVFTVTLTTYEGEEIVLEAQPFMFPKG